MSKKVAQANQIVKLIVGAGQAAPTPPVGPALGSKGVKSMDFCKVCGAEGWDAPPWACGLICDCAGIQRKDSTLYSCTAFIAPELSHSVLTIV
jgi:hypothetical protein